MTETAVIIADRVTFYHQHDEAAFFGWLDSMDVVNGYVGRGTSLHIGLCRSPNDDDLRDLLAIHQRYGIDMHSRLSRLTQMLVGSPIPVLTGMAPSSEHQRCEPATSSLRLGSAGLDSYHDFRVRALMPSAFR